MDKIHIGLYGGKGLFGGKETPLRAETVLCDSYNECGFYKNGKCLNVTAPLSGKCKFGSISTTNGYTSRSQKYEEFRRRHLEDPIYGKLSYPSESVSITPVGDWVCLIIPHARYQDGRIEVPYFSSGISWIENRDFDADLVKRFCDFRPVAIMGGVIENYRAEQIPNLIISLRHALPDLYAKFISKYPQYDFVPNYVGKRAKLTTLNSGTVKYTSTHYPEFNEVWDWDGEYLSYKSGYINAPKICKKWDSIEMRIKPNINTTVEITSNDQVNDKTEFEL